MSDTTQNVADSKPSGSLAHTGADGNTQLGLAAGGLLSAGVAALGVAGINKRRAARGAGKPDAA
ncbi:hypothetical protein O1L60_47580 [Streptomyces diastatochromogenes]|nr:hypothetical protein [Streptomyces diastatochromogenes]